MSCSRFITGNLESDLENLRIEMAKLRESLALSQARVRELEDMLDDGSVIPRQPDIEGAP